jgi:outer membrane protein assembly factor BamB
MKHSFYFSLLSCLVFNFGTAAIAEDDADAIAVAVADWHYWRGAASAGVAPEGNYPVRWDVDTNTDWRIELYGRGGSTPVAAGNFALVTFGEDGQNQLMAVEIDSGEIAWITTLGDDTGGKHKKGSGSNPSPVTDGTLIYAYYRSGDLACVDLSGKVVWQRNLQVDFGSDSLWWDLGSSPILSESTLIVAVMQSPAKPDEPKSPSYLVSLDKQSGDVVWKVDRELGAPEEAAQSYTSPVLATVDGRAVIAVMGADHLTVNDLASGEELGRLGGFNPKGDSYFRSIASPVVSGSIVVCPYSRGSTLTAVDLGKLIAGKDRESILWHRDDLGSDVPTPATRDGKVYLCGDRGLVTTLDVTTGKEIWSVELPRNRNQFSSSPLLTKSHLYLTREDGQVFVIALPNGNDKATLVSQNSLGDDEQYTVASPVPLNDAILFRTAKTLIKIGL